MSHDKSLKYYSICWLLFEFHRNFPKNYRSEIAFIPIDTSANGGRFERKLLSFDRATDELNHFPILIGMSGSILPAI